MREPSFEDKIAAARRAEKKRIIAKNRVCEKCGGSLVAKGYCWRCEDCGIHYARAWKTDPYGVRGK